MTGTEIARLCLCGAVPVRPQAYKLKYKNLAIEVKIMSEIAAASSLQVDYMKLLTTQLQNQNPLEPMDNSQMTAQLTQFSQLSQLETMNTRFADVLKTVEQNHAASLLGKQVSFIGKTSLGTTDLVSGTVDQVVNNNGEVLLGVGDYSLTLNDIISVK
jgi:flagellar basal-body rod modification protein FlgD